MSQIDSNGRTIWIVDAHGYGARFIVRVDEKLIAFLELQSTIRATERPEDCGARASKPRQIAAMMVKAPSITSSDVSTYLRHG